MFCRKMKVFHYATVSWDRYIELVWVVIDIVDLSVTISNVYIYMCYMIIGVFEAFMNIFDMFIGLNT